MGGVIYTRSRKDEKRKNVFEANLYPGFNGARNDAAGSVVISETFLEWGLAADAPA
jgi:hypothetical protein